MGGAFLKESSDSGKGSSFMVDHMDELISFARRMGVREKAEDLFLNAFMGMKKRESEGKGYDYVCAKSKTEISLRRFCFGTIKKYAMNPEYRSDIIQSVRDGEMVVVAASTTSERIEDMTAAQMAYENAVSEKDGLQDVLDRESLRDDIEEILTFGLKTNVKDILLHVSEYLEAGKDTSIFKTLREELNYHTEIKELFVSVLDFRSRNREVFDSVMATI
jgi:hypothetical protein